MEGKKRLGEENKLNISRISDANIENSEKNSGIDDEIDKAMNAKDKNQNLNSDTKSENKVSDNKNEEEEEDSSQDNQQTPWFKFRKPKQ